MNGANSNSPSTFWSGVEGVCQTCICRPTPTAKWRPEGENASAETGDLKVKWWRAIRRGTLVNIAWPSSSTESSRLPRGVRPSLVIFFRCAKGRVWDLLLQENQIVAWSLNWSDTHFTRSKIVTRFPTGEKRQDPSGLKSRFPWL